VRTPATANGSNSGHQVPPLPLKVAARHSQIYGRQRSPAVITTGKNRIGLEMKRNHLNIHWKLFSKMRKLKIETIDFLILNLIWTNNIWKNGTRKLIKATSFFPLWNRLFNGIERQVTRTVPDRSLEPVGVLFKFVFISLRGFLFCFVRWVR
jgi:hypothetical protein